MNKSLCFLLFLQIGIISKIYAQPTSTIEVQDKTFIVPFSDNLEYVARDYLSFKPGFHYTATSTNSFKGSIDEKLLFPPVTNTYVKPDGSFTNDPQEGYAVGSIPGSMSVNPMGGAVYQVPIQCTPGINGMQPQVVLSYNSQTGNGIVGWGWNISGGSSINRVNKTIYHDGKTESIKWNEDDALALDGNRLIRVNSTNYPNSVEYRTEIDQMNKIIAFNFSDQGPQYFKVYSKSGIVSTYTGEVYVSKTNEQVNLSIDFFLGDPQVDDTHDESLWRGEGEIDISSSTSSVYKNWLLTNVEDANGNYVQYHYIMDYDGHSDVDNVDVKCSHLISGRPHCSISSYPTEFQLMFNDDVNVTTNDLYRIAEHTRRSQYEAQISERLDYIEYGSHSQMIGKVHFNYSNDRFEDIEGYVAGYKQKQTYRLQNIESYSGNTLLRNYTLN